MKYQIAIYSADAVFARMLELEFVMRGKSVSRATQTQSGVYADVVLLDLDSCSVPVAGSYGRLIGFTANSALLADEASRQCSMILHRPFEMRLLRREVLTDGTELFDAFAGSFHSFSREQDRLELTLDAKTSTLRVGEEAFSLSPNEYAIVASLLEHRGAAVSRAVLSELIGESSANKVDVYICFLRRKLDETLGYKLIYTVRGMGYMIK